jgi:GrpB-like predicted nucleotidyltransferase (UPF0157 family)
MPLEDPVTLSPYDRAWPSAFEARSAFIEPIVERALSLGYPRA